MDLKAVAYASCGAAIPILGRALFVVIMKDFARRFSFTIIGVKAYDQSIGRLHRDQILSGAWEVTWTVRSNNFAEKSSWEAQLYRCLDTVAIEGVGITKTGQKIPYGFVGKLSRDKTIVTGTWFDRRGSSSGYHGSYQLRIPGSGEIASGKWIGFSDNSPSVKSGDLTWTKRLI